MDYVACIVYLIMLISSTRGTPTPHDSSNDNSVNSSGNSPAMQTEISSTTQTTQGNYVPENDTSTASLSPAMGSAASSKSRMVKFTTISNTHTPKLLNKTNIAGCDSCIVGNNGTPMFISCAVNGTNTPSIYLGGSNGTLHEKEPGLWNYLLPAHKIAKHHNDIIICNVTDPSTNTTLEDTARFYDRVSAYRKNQANLTVSTYMGGENRLNLTFTQANGLFTVLCVAKGRPAPKLKIVTHLSETSYNVTVNDTTPPSGDEKMSTSKIEFLVTCTPYSKQIVKCCDDQKICPNETLPACPGKATTTVLVMDNSEQQGLPQTPHSSTGGVTLNDISSASTTVVITTYFSENHTSPADRGETQQWLLPVIIVATVVGAVIVVIVIAFLISLTPSRASRQQGPFVNRGLQWGNHAEQVERYEMNANRDDGPHDTAVYANANTEVTIAPYTQSPHSASLALGPDTDCNALGPDFMHDTRFYSKARPVDWEEETTVPGEQKELTYVDLDFSENQQTPGPSNVRYQPVEYVMVDFTQTKTMKSE